MKNKFQRLSKEERKEALKKYAEKNPGSYIKFKKLSGICKFGIIYSIIILCGDIYFRNTLFSKSFNANILLDCILLIFCVIFYTFSKNTIESQTNKMLVEELRQEQIAKWKKEEEQDKKKSSKKKSTTKKTTTKKTTKTTKKTTKKSSK